MTRILTIIALLFSTPAWAESRAMHCRGTTLDFTYKYEAGFFKDRCYRRAQGRWRELDEFYEAADWSCVSNLTGENYKTIHVIDFLELKQKNWSEGRAFAGPPRWSEMPCEEVVLPD
jgi:hypothetical protein